MSKKRFFIKYFPVFFLLGFFQFLFLGISNAANHYVSPTGKAAWADSTNINTPCSVSTAFANAQAGDTVYFRGGTYSVPAKNSGTYLTGYYMPSNSGSAGNPITFAANPGETPLFDGTSGGTGEYETSPTDCATIFGTGNHNYITFDGFSLQADGGTKQARVVIAGSDSSHRINNIIVKNFTINGGSTTLTTTDIREGIFLQSTDYVTIQRCKIYRYRQVSNYGNTTGIKTYGHTYLTIENCEIYDCSIGIYLKTSAQYDSIRYNFIHDNYDGFHMNAYTGSQVWNNRGNKIYHNVAVNNTYSNIAVTAEDTADNDNTEIYNNTIYGPDHSWGIMISVGKTKLWNNIVEGCSYGPGGSDSGNKLTQSTTATKSKELMECDYNQWGTVTAGHAFQILMGRDHGPYATYSTFALWKASTQLDTVPPSNPDTHGLASDPKFVNGSGTFKQLNDFRLATNSPCKGVGKGGIDMGANIDLIVLPPTSRTTSLTAPKNLSIIK